MKPETEHMLSTLRTAMRILGFTFRDLERKLGLSASYLSRLFSGGIDLKYDHIVDLSHAMGIETAEILHAAYPGLPAPPSPAAARIRDITRGFHMGAGILEFERRSVALDRPLTDAERIQAIAEGIKRSQDEARKSRGE